MLAKCANPTCSTPLVYLREGKIFMVESPQPQFELLNTVPAKPKAGIVWNTSGSAAHAPVR